MGTNECSQPASKSSWDSQDFGDISMVLKMAHFCKSTGPRWVKWDTEGDMTPRRVMKLKVKQTAFTLLTFETIRIMGFVICFL